MLELVITACFITGTGPCRDYTLNFDAPNATPMQCMMYGQMEMAKWLEGHPNLRITKWRCGPPGREANL